MGEIFSTKNLKVIRPGDGLEPKYLEMILGKVARKDFRPGHPLTFEDII